MTLVRFISLSCHFIFFYISFFCFLFFFFSLTSFVSAGSERREGGSDPAFMMERTGTLGITFFSVIFSFFISTVCQCPLKSSSASFLRILEIYQVLKVEREEGTSPPWTCNILWTTDEQKAWLIIRLGQEQMTDNDDEEMKWFPSPCPRERKLALILV